MIHKMRLNKGPFEVIKSGKKKIELRLFDEKRKLINIGDSIEFISRDSNEKIITKVITLHKYDSFFELYKHFDKIILGYKKDEIAKPEDMEKYYSKEEQEKYGVVGIEIELSSLYEIIKNDPYIIDRYNKIEIIEDKNLGHAYHNYTHVLNVASIIEKVLKCLNYDDEFIEKAKIAGIMHDTGALEGKNNHTLRSYDNAIKYFEDNNIDFEGIDLVCDAIKNHSSGFDTDNIITLTLILADKLDIKKTRIAKGGEHILGLRQLLYVDDIKLNINNKNLKIEFIADEKIDLDELNEYYFIKKLFKSIKAFSSKLSLDYSILMNDKIWSIGDL